MDFFSRIVPAYKRADALQQTAAYSPAVAPSGLTSLIGSLVGSSTPAYKSADGSGAAAPASSGLWSIFSVAPSYKTAPIEMIGSEDLDAESGVDEGGACVCVPGPTEILVL